MNEPPNEGFCWSCGYALAVHVTADPLWRDRPWPDPDPDGGCPADEIDAMRRWGLM